LGTGPLVRRFRLPIDSTAGQRLKPTVNPKRGLSQATPRDGIVHETSHAA
jgi:hypothetical protein